MTKEEAVALAKTHLDKKDCYENQTVLATRFEGWLVSFPVIRRDDKGEVTLRAVCFSVHDDGSVQKKGLM